MDTHATTIVGFGNPLRGDEGIGPRLVNLLQQRWNQVLQTNENQPTDRRIKSVRFVELGTAAMRLLNELPQTRRLIIIDCAFMGRHPGDMVKFTPADVESVKQLSALSLHDMDILRILEMGRAVGDVPDEIVIFGIQPVTIDYSMQLSPLLEKNLLTYATTIEYQLT